MRHVSLDPYCYNCDLVMESGWHALRDCPRARNVWNEVLPLSRRRKFFQEQNLERWFKSNIRSILLA